MTSENTMWDCFEGYSMFHCAYRDNVYLHDTHSFFRAGFLLFAWVSWRLGKGARKREKTNAEIEHFFCHVMDHLEDCMCE